MKRRSPNIVYVGDVIPLPSMLDAQVLGIRAEGVVVRAIGPSRTLPICVSYTLPHRCLPGII